MLSFRDHSKPWGLESVVIFLFFDVCLWFIYKFFWLVILLFFGVTLLFKGCFVFYLGVGWWFWIDFGGVFFWGGGQVRVGKSCFVFPLYATNVTMITKIIPIVFWLLLLDIYSIDPCMNCLLSSWLVLRAILESGKKKPEKITYTCISTCI